MGCFSISLAVINLLVFLAADPGPQGEGSLVGDTPILLAGGETKAVEDLVPGDLVAGWDAEKGSVPVRVKSIDRKNASGYWVLKAGDATLRGSGNLWLAVAKSRLWNLKDVDETQTVFGPGGKALKPLKVTSTREYPANLPLFNVELDTPGLFFAGGILVHD